MQAMALFLRRWLRARTVRAEAKKYREKDQCKRCRGKRVVGAKAKLRLDIPRGAYDGQRIVFEGEGDQLPDTQPASIIFELKQKPHDTFQVKQLDLLATVRVTLSEALLGFSRTVLTHLDHRHIHITRKPGQVIRPGQVDIVRGEGMVDQRYRDHKGDLFLQWDIEFPTEAWASSVDAKALEALLPPKRPVLAPPEDLLEEVTTAPGQLDDFGSHIGTKQQEDQRNEHDDDEPNVQCAQQ